MLGHLKNDFFIICFLKVKKKDKSVFNKKKGRKNSLLKSNEQASWRTLLLKKRRLRKKSLKVKNSV